MRFAITLLAGLVACAQAPVPEATPTPATTAAPQPAPSPGAQRAGGANADAQFLQHMIAHHAQALTMTALVPSRTSRTDLLLLAERIAVSQKDEIETMQRWLRERGHAVPDPAHAHHDATPHANMPGMLTTEELYGLSSSTGAGFERRFLELMIKHHEGALTMVRELFARPGGGQDSQIFAIANEVEADQRMEIDRMRRMLGPPSPPTGQ